MGSGVVLSGSLLLLSANIFLWSSRFVFNSPLFLLYQLSFLGALLWLLVQIACPQTRPRADLFAPRIFSALLVTHCWLLASNPLILVIEDFNLYRILRGLLWICFAVSIFWMVDVWTGRKIFRVPLGISLLILATLMVFCKVLLLLISAHPPIDVFVWSQEAAEVLLRGENPYTHAYRNLGTEPYGYGPVFPYLPGVLFFLAPFAAAGLDIRLASVGADVLIFALIVWIYRHRFKSSWGEALAPAAIYLTWPTVFRFIELAWNDMILFSMLLLGGVLLLAQRTRSAIVVLGLAVTLKQYAAFAAGFFMVMAIVGPLRISGKKIFEALALFALAPALLVIPFFLWDSQGFLRSIIEIPKGFPLRFDSYGFQATLLRHGWVESRIEGMGLIFCLVWLVCGAHLVWRMRRVPDADQRFEETLLHIAFFYGVAFLFGHHAFLNHYYFSSTWLTIAAVLCIRKVCVSAG